MVKMKLLPARYKVISELSNVIMPLTHLILGCFIADDLYTDKSHYIYFSKNYAKY